MKKFLAFFLSIMVVFSVAAMFTTVGASGHDPNNEIAYIDYLDFSAENNKWNELNDDGSLKYTTFKDADKDIVNGKYYYPFALWLDNESSGLDMEYLQGGEVIRFTATEQKDPRIAFEFDKLNTFGIGSQSSNGAEYVKIRFKNNSPSTKITFMGTNNSWGNGKLDARIRATIDVEPNSSEWQTITFSMVEGTQNTTGTAAWGSYLKKFAIYPFGYGKDNETIVNPKYNLEIDYVIVGSKEYCDSYTSALEDKESAAISFTADTAEVDKEYFLGETLNLEGLKGQIKYGTDKDGNPLYADETEIVDLVSAVYNFDKPEDEEGDSWMSTVTLIYGGLRQTYEVKVYDIKGIDFVYETDKETDVDKKTYNKIDILRAGSFTPTGIQVKVTYAKAGESKILDISEVDLIGTEFTDDVPLSEGGYYEYLVTVNYHGRVLYLPVKLIDIAEIIITPKEDKKNSIYYGTNVTSEFFDISCKYTNGEVLPFNETGLDTIDSNAKKGEEQYLYFSVTCDTKISGGTVPATAKLVIGAYSIDLATTVDLTVNTPKDIVVSLRKDSFDVDDSIPNSMFTVKYVYDGYEATVDQNDPNLVFNYDTTAPGEHTGVVKIGGKDASFNYTIKEATFKEGILPVNRGGAKVDLLAPKFPTFWLVTIIAAIVVVVIVAFALLLKYVFKVDFKNRKKVSLDDIF